MHFAFRDTFCTLIPAESWFEEIKDNDLRGEQYKIIPQIPLPLEMAGVHERGRRAPREVGGLDRSNDTSLKLFTHVPNLLHIF